MAKESLVVRGIMTIDSSNINKDIQIDETSGLIATNTLCVDGNVIIGEKGTLHVMGDLTVKKRLILLSNVELLIDGRLLVTQSLITNNSCRVRVRKTMRVNESLIMKGDLINVFETLSVEASLCIDKGEVCVGGLTGNCRVCLGHGVTLVVSQDVFLRTDVPNGLDGGIIMGNNCTILVKGAVNTDYILINKGGHLYVSKSVKTQSFKIGECSNIEIGNDLVLPKASNSILLMDSSKVIIRGQLKASRLLLQGIHGSTLLINSHATIDNVTNEAEEESRVCVKGNTNIRLGTMRVMGNKTHLIIGEKVN